MQIIAHLSSFGQKREGHHFMDTPEIVAINAAIHSWQITIDHNLGYIEECFEHLSEDRRNLRLFENLILSKRRENAALRCLIRDAEARIFHRNSISTTPQGKSSRTISHQTLSFNA